MIFLILLLVVIVLLVAVLAFLVLLRQQQLMDADIQAYNAQMLTRIDSNTEQIARMISPRG